MLETEKVDELFRLLDEMTRTTIGDPKLAPRLPRLLIIMRELEKFCLIGFFFTWLVLFWLRYGTPPPDFSDNELVFGGIWLVFLIVFVLTFIVNRVCDKWPPKQFVSYMKLSQENALRRDTQLIAELLKFDKATLIYGLLQYRHRWSSFEDRFVASVGDLRKLGLLPALAALFISAATFRKDSTRFIWDGLVVLVASFYVMAFAALLIRQRPQQVIQLLEYAIQHVDQCNTTPSDAITSASSVVCGIARKY